MTWNKFSENRLIAIEKKILSVVKSTYKCWHVPIKSPTGGEEKIWTMALNEESSNTPLVLLHGFAAGIGFWCLNFDSLSARRPVYAIDILGFGRSTRPKFSKDSLEAEKQMVDSIEEWRKELKLDKIILLGHSMGGFLASSYAISYPDHVKHLILVDPWGYSDRDKDRLKQASLRIRTIATLISPLAKLNPLASIRGAGPFGPWLIQKVRGDISHKYSEALEDSTVIGEYIYHCNAQNPSGETAFHNMQEGIVGAKHPMIHRIHNLRRDVPITTLFGSESWIDQNPAQRMIELRPDSYVNIQIVPGAGHHIHADQPSLFNNAVNAACLVSDKGHDQIQIRSPNVEEPFNIIDKKYMDVDYNTVNF